MTNCTNKMGGRTGADCHGRTKTPPNPSTSPQQIGARPRSATKLRTTTPPTIGTPPRSKPINITGGSSNHNHYNRDGSTSPRTSPGLIAGYFAGGKWSDPPSPASLPKPPHHWTTAGAQLSYKFSAGAVPENSGRQDIANQLKVLLNVQA